MAKKPDLKKLDTLFDTNNEFTLTDKQYKNRTGARLPENLYYLKNNSALAKKCRKYGFSMSVQEKTVTFKKIEVEGK